jgi:hypothetical protein
MATAFQREYQEKYGEMFKAATEVPKDDPLYTKFKEVCQSNPWLKVGGIDFEDGLYCESDYPFRLKRYDDIAMLKAFFHHGNWAIREAVVFKDLLFVNQINGGDEWWTIKITDGGLMPFESITWQACLREFEEMINRMHLASPGDCKSLNY